MALQCSLTIFINIAMSLQPVEEQQAPASTTTRKIFKLFSLCMTSIIIIIKLQLFESL